MLLPIHRELAGGGSSRPLLDHLPASTRHTSAWPPALELRRVKSLEEYQSCEAIQDRIWGAGDVVRLTSLVMITAQNSGGMVIGAFVDAATPVGFVCSYPGVTGSGRLRQCSQLMAVDPKFQSTNIGYRLKLAQRQKSLALGMELVTWTFDPLASPNAYLNIKKLGGICSQYRLDCYGTASGGLNGGLPTDRLLLEWWVDSPWVEQRLRGSTPLPFKGPWVVTAEGGEAGRPRPAELELSCAEPVLRAEIPERFHEIKKADRGLALAWRQAMQEVFQTYFSRGYRVVSFERYSEGGRARCGYLLEKPGTTRWPVEPPAPITESLWGDFS